MNGGYDPVGGWQIGPQTPKLTECKSFEEFYGYYLRHSRHYIEAEAEFEAYEYEITGTRHPFIMPSLLYDGCVAKAKALFEGGCEYLAGTLEYYGTVDAADGLCAIRKLVFEDKSMSAQTMMDALADNFTDYPRERKLMLDAPKYGADNSEADEMLVKLTDFFNQTTAEQAERVGLKKLPAGIYQ